MQNQSFRMIPIGDLVPSGANPRKTFDEAKLGELAESIRTHGILQPILVRPRRVFNSEMAKALNMEEENVQGFEIVAGERRYRAALKAGLTELPCVVRDLDDRATLECQVIENLQRDDLDPVEEAEGYEALMKEHGYTIEQLVEKLGKSRSYVYGRVKLVALSDGARAALTQGHLSPSVALLVARIPDPKLRKEACEMVIRPGNDGPNPLTYRQAKEEIERRYMIRLKDCPFPQGDPDLLPDAGACKSCPKLTGNQKEVYRDVGSTDVCTDPSCYARKVQAFWKRLRAHDLPPGTIPNNVVQSDNYRCLSEAETKKLYPYGSNSGLYSNHFHRLEEKVWEDPKRRTYEELLKEADVPTVLALVDNQIVRLVESEAAKKALRETYEWAKWHGNSSRTLSESEKKQRQEVKDFGEIFRRAIDELIKAAETASPDETFWHFLAFHYANSSRYDLAKAIIKRRGLDEKLGNAQPWHKQGIVAQSSQGFTMEQCRGLLVELLVGGTFFYSTEFSDKFKAAAKVFRINLAAISREVKAERERAKKKAGKRKEGKAA